MSTAKNLSKELGKTQKSIDIARSRGISMRELLQYDHVADSHLFNDYMTSKPQKHTIIAELENHLANHEFHFDAGNTELTAIIVDFMSMVRKVQFTKLNTFSESFERVWMMIQNICNASEFHFVFDSYIQNSLKECEGERRGKEGAVDIVNLSADTSIPVEMERFWASSKNKHNLQLLSRDYFIEKAKKPKEITVVLSGYVSDANVIESGILIKHGVEFEKKELKSSLDEADHRIIQHIAIARKTDHLILKNFG